MNALILGAGPSGMMAAHAASHRGYHVTIWDRDPDKTRRNSGVYFLHEDCFLALDAVDVQQRVLGSDGMSSAELAAAYGDKVYGSAAKVSKVSVVGANSQTVIRGYNSGQAIARLWDFYGGQVEKQNVADLHEVQWGLERYDVVISTIPFPVLFPYVGVSSEQVWIKWGQAPPDEAFVFYNVNPHAPWYRCSAIFGVFTMEYAHGYKPTRTKGYRVGQVTKVIRRHRDPIVPERLILTGRYGAWNKSFLTHTVFSHVLQELCQLE